MRRVQEGGRLCGKSSRHGPLHSLSEGLPWGHRRDGNPFTLHCVQPGSFQPLLDFKQAKEKDSHGIYRRHPTPHLLPPVCLLLIWELSQNASFKHQVSSLTLSLGRSPSWPLSSCLRLSNIADSGNQIIKSPSCWSPIGKREVLQAREKEVVTLY